MLRRDCYYNYHRYYDPSIGRYLRPDPIGLAGGINLFVYAQNNPINWIDPGGLCRKKGESYKDCLDRRASEEFGILTDIADGLGYYGIVSTGLSAAGWVATGYASQKIGGAALQSADKYAQLAGANQSGTIIDKVSASIRTGKRVSSLKSIFSFATKGSVVLGLGATAGSGLIRAPYIVECLEDCSCP